MDDVTAPLFERGKGMLDQLLRIAQTRLEMLSVEIQREKLELAVSFRLAVALAVCGWLCGFTLILWAALALPPHLRSVVLAGLFVAFLAASLGCWLALQRRAGRKPLFKRVIQQLERDRAALRGKP